MKILSIKGENIASLPSFDLDFTQPPLSEAGIFAITGKTGAGKSTILDSLCLALFNTTPRLHKAHDKKISVDEISQSDVRGLLRRGAAQAWVEVQFAGITGEEYTARWSVRRAYNKVDGSLQSVSHGLYKGIEPAPGCDGLQTISTQLSSTHNEVAQAIGLQFEQFTRAVLLAQGDFTAFLKASSNNKAELLEKLTGTNIYTEISKSIFHKAKEADQHYHEEQARTDGIEILTPEEEADTIALQDCVQALFEQAQEEEKHAEHTKERQQNRIRQEAAIATAQEELANQVKLEEESKPRKARLAKIEKAQEARPYVEKVADYRRQAAQQKQRIDAQKQSIASYQKQVSQAQIETNTAEQDLKSLKQQIKQQQPEIEQAQKLDQQLIYQQDQVAAQQQQVGKQQTDLKEQEQQQQQKATEIKAIEEAIAKAENWLTQHADKRAIAENIQTITTRLKGVSEELVLTHTLNEKQKSTEASLQKAQAALKEHQRGKAQLNDLIATLQPNIASVTLKVAAFDAEQIASSLEQAQARMSGFKEAKDLAQRNKELGAELSDLELYCQQKQEQLATHQQEVAIIEQELPTVKAQLDEATTAYEEAKILANKDIKNLREQLSPDKPCPVCGSIHHPYSQQGETALQSQHTDLKEKWERLNDAVRQREQRNIELNTLTEVLKEQLASKEKDLEKLKQSIHGIQKKRESLSHTLGISIHSNIDEETEKLTAQIQDLKRQDQKGKADQQELQKLKDELASNHEKAREQERLEQEQLAALGRIEQEQAYIAEQQAKAQHELANCQTDLSEFFTSNNWFEKWKGNSQHFLEQLAKFATDWASHTQQAELKSNELLLAKETLHNKQDVIAKMQQELQSAKLTLTQLEEGYRKTRQARQHVLGGQSVKDIQMLWEKEEARLQQGMEKSRQHLQSSQISLETSQASKIEQEQQYAQLQQELNKALKQLEHWKTNAQAIIGNFSEATLQEWLSLEKSEIEQERNFFQKLQETTISLQATLQDRKASLAKMPEAAISTEAVQETENRLHQLAAAKEKIAEERQSYQLILRNQQLNKNKIASMQEELDRAKSKAEQWKKLSDLIGSSDGAKFRRYAQGYTLDILLSYANQQLVNLAPRYKLETNDSSELLGIQVIDQDMGNEVRSVFSLSGGETFLVSLALALGLSSLSSSQMNVESLFIDEGFGTLDAETLGVAMEALERLQGQGRKVGIISHVQEMTERIPVQVAVHKAAGGESHVEVLG